MIARTVQGSCTPPAKGMEGLRAMLLDLIAAVHDQETELGARPNRTETDHAVLAALFAARVGLQDQIVTLRRADILGQARPEVSDRSVARACRRMSTALFRSATSDQLIPSALEGIAAAQDLLAALRDESSAT